MFVRLSIASPNRFPDLLGLRRCRLHLPEGASNYGIVAATGWQPHTVHGAVAEAQKKKLGLDVTSEKDEKRAGPIALVPDVSAPRQPPPRGGG